MTAGSFHPAKELKVFEFGLGDPLQTYSETDQGKYIRRYLADLGAKSVVEEPYYFDRDYLAEFACYYGSSARGYPNVCRRLHFFGVGVDRRKLAAFLAGGGPVRGRLLKHYLGFVVLRPVPWAPFGRTVLAWYPEPTPHAPRITKPSRNYTVHLAGVPLNVKGIAWQQQDTDVGACATIALWSALQSSAFDTYHAVPTTAEITQAANTTASLGARIFPSKGLTLVQLCEAIKELGLAPIVCDGDIPSESEHSAFSKERFTAVTTALARSGFPTLLLGRLDSEPGNHATCMVGFRSNGSRLAPGGVALADAETDTIYVHDDNIGPNVRMRIEATGPGGCVRVKAEAPPSSHQSPWEDPTLKYWKLEPWAIVCAVPDNIRMGVDSLLAHALHMSGRLRGDWELLFGASQPPFAVSVLLVRASDYAGDILGTTLRGTPKALSTPL